MIPWRRQGRQRVVLTLPLIDGNQPLNPGNKATRNSITPKRPIVFAFIDKMTSLAQDTIAAWEKAGMFAPSQEKIR